MSIRKIVSPDMQTAMRRVRAELGADAVILGSQPVPGGVEVAAQAADDLDESGSVDTRSVRRWADALKRRASSGGESARGFAGALAGAMGAMKGESPESPGGENADDGHPVEAPAGDQTGHDEIVRMRRELQALRDLVETRPGGRDDGSESVGAGEPAAARESVTSVEEDSEPSSPAPNARPSATRISLREHADVMGGLVRLGLDRDICGAIAARVHAQPCADSPEGRIEAASEILTRSIPVAENDILERGGVIALLGATGVGKTTTAAKLAAQFTLRHGPRKVALVTTDNLRVGAREQLRIFARAIACPVLAADSPQALAEVIDGLADKPLVIIDTAGISHRDLQLSEQLSGFELSAGRVDCYAVLSATTQVAPQAACLRALAGVSLKGCIISKTDDAISLGGVLTSVIRHQLAVSHVTTGPRVPDDIERADAAALMAAAIELAEQSEADAVVDSAAWGPGNLVAGL